MTIVRWLILGAGLSLVAPAGISTVVATPSKKPPPGKYAKKAFPAKGSQRPAPGRTDPHRTAQLKRRRTVQRRRPVARCRDIFCTAQVVRLDGGDGKTLSLSQQQVETTMKAQQGRLEHCLVQARRRDPAMQNAHIEFVVHRRGTVLATRVNGKRRTSLARCIHSRLRSVRFPRSSPLRTVASFSMAIPN